MGRSLRGTCDQILECCEEPDLENRFDVDFFRNPKRVRPTVVYKLIHYEKNRELLMRFPISPFSIWR